METKLREGGVKFTWDKESDTLTAFCCIELNFPLQLDAYRAKKEVIQTLKVYFLLDPDIDFWLNIGKSTKGYGLIVQFTSACGRYAFWRLNNNNAPEALKRLAGNG